MDKLFLCIISSCLIFGVTCMCITMIRKYDTQLPNEFPKNFSRGWYVLLGSISILCMCCETKHLPAVTALMILVSISAYTDYYTKTLYSAISFFFALIGWIWIGMSGQISLIEVGMAAIISVFPECVKCFARGDTWLLFAMYPYLGIILGDVVMEVRIIWFLIVIFVALLLSVLKNLLKLRKNFRLQVAYAPYNLAAVCIFILLAG